ncbi:MAG: hypothetical protein Q8P67_29280, partial [archaeon]|nr:hypothetical protein [archaeon]
MSSFPPPLESSFQLAAPFSSSSSSSSSSFSSSSSSSSSSLSPELSPLAIHLPAHALDESYFHSPATSEPTPSGLLQLLGGPRRGPVFLRVAAVYRFIPDLAYSASGAPVRPGTDDDASDREAA